MSNKKKRFYLSLHESVHEELWNDLERAKSKSDRLLALAVMGLMFEKMTGSGFYIPQKNNEVTTQPLEQQKEEEVVDNFLVNLDI